MATEKAMPAGGAGGGRNRGQALVELAIGMVAVALVLSALFSFAKCILAALDIQRDIRADAGKEAFSSSSGGSKSETRTVALSGPAEREIFRGGAAKLKDSVYLPPMKLDDVK